MINDSRLTGNESKVIEDRVAQKNDMTYDALRENWCRTIKLNGPNRQDI